jgi:hypothetical protein
MFIDESDRRDHVFAIVLVIAVVAALVGMRLYANHLHAQKAVAPPTSEQSRTQEQQRVLHLEAITNVYECERDGQRVLTDRPCGVGVPIRVIR